MYKLQKKVDHAHEDSIWAVSWAKSNVIVTGSIDETVKVWDPNDLSKPKHIFGSHELAIVSVDCSGDGKRAVTSSMDGQIRVYDIEAGKKIQTITAGAVDTWTVAYQPNMDVVASGSHSGAVNLWDMKSGKKANTLQTEGKFTMSLSYSNDGAFLASGSHDGIVHIFDSSSNKSLHKISAHNLAVRSLSFNPSGTVLVTASEDAHIKSYDVKGGNQEKNITGHSSWVLSVQMNPKNSRQLASSSSDKKVKIWDFQTNEAVHTFDSHEDQVWGVSYSPDGNYLATVSDDSTLQIFEVKEK
jgi:WD repeat-containing protein 61